MEVHFVVPEGIRDPARPSGGNTYDTQLIRGLVKHGWAVHEHPVNGEAALAAALRAIPDGAVVLLDGLIASTAPETLVPEATRLRQVVLLHMPLCDSRERAVLAAATAVITTSAWSRGRLNGLPQVSVAEPGVAPAVLAAGSSAGDGLLCVAAVAPHKGHDVLLDALATIRDVPWRCLCVGSLDRDPSFADRVLRRARELGDRVRFVGPRTGAALDRAYAEADLLVLPSRAESYGMVVTEALARGVPVLAADVGGVSEALGGAGLLVTPDDPAALAAALRDWLADAALRERLRRVTRERRASLRGWEETTGVVAGVLAEAAR